MAESDPTVKLCECGCGQPTNLSKCTDAYGIKGQYRRYIFGHRRPKPTTTGYIETAIGKIHRIRAETALGKPLPAKAVVHHPDHDPWNPNARLVICENQAFHRLLHRLERVKRAGGNPHTQKICSGCHELKDLAVDFTISRQSPGGYDTYCRACKKPRQAAAFQRRRARARQRLEVDRSLHRVETTD